MSDNNDHSNPAASSSGANQDQLVQSIPNVEVNSRADQSRVDESNADAGASAAAGTVEIETEHAADRNDPSKVTQSSSQVGSPPPSFSDLERKQSSVEDNGVVTPKSSNGVTQAITGDSVVGDAKSEVISRQGILAFCISETSQFTHGGESACAFGSLAIAQRLLTEYAETFPSSNNSLDDCIKDAANHFETFFDGKPRSHASAFEILGEYGEIFYPSLQLKTWQESPVELSQIYHKLVFPEAFLGMGDLQIQNATTEDIKNILQGFQKKNVAVLFVTIGYAFGVHCRSDGNFVVFDTHRKTFDTCPVRLDSSMFPSSSERAKSFWSKSGAYAVMLSSVDDATRFIDDFTLDSRKAILAMQFGAAEGYMQEQSASAIQICVVGTK